MALTLPLNVQPPTEKPDLGQNYHDLSLFDNAFTNRAYKSYIFTYGLVNKDEAAITGAIERFQAALDRLALQWPSLLYSVKTFYDHMRIVKPPVDSKYEKLTLVVDRVKAKDFPTYAEIKERGFPPTLMSHWYFSCYTHLAWKPNKSRVFAAKLSVIEGGFFLTFTMLDCFFDMARVGAILSSFAGFCDPIGRFDMVKSLIAPQLQIDREINSADAQMLLKQCKEWKSIPLTGPYGKERRRDFRPSWDVALHTSIFQFKVPRLIRIKNESNAHSNAQPNLDYLDYLPAFIWAHVMKAKGLLSTLLGYSQTVKMFYPVNVRRRVEPNIPNNYLGTATLPVQIDCDLQDLTTACRHSSEEGQAALAKVTESIRTANWQVNDQFVRSRLQLARSIKDIQSLRLNIDRRENADVIYEDMLRIPMGMGAKWHINLVQGHSPQAFRVRPAQMRNGTIKVLPSNTHGFSGIIEVEITLYEDDMLRLCEDTDWMKEVERVIDPPKGWSPLPN